MKGDRAPIRLKPISKQQRFLFQITVLAGCIERFVPLGVGAVKRGWIKRLLRTDAGLVRSLDRITIGLRVPPRGQACAGRLEPGHGFEHFNERGKAELHDLRPLPRPVLDHAARLELTQCLTNRCSRGFEATSERLLVETSTRP